MALELTPLRHFLAVADETSISRAAQRLHLAQPALSRQMNRLEADLGVRLLLRTARGVELTPAGVALAEHARRLLAGVDDAVAAVRDAGRPAPVVRAAFHCTTAAQLMPPVLAHHRRRDPGARVEVVQLDFLTQVQRLREGTLDVALLRPFCDTSGLVRETLAREPVVAVLPPDHPLAGRAELPLTALAGERWIAMSAAVTGAAARAAMLARLRDAGVEGPVLAAGDTAQAGVAMVAAGLGVFACPLSTARSTPADVATVPIEGWTTTVDMVWRPGPLEPAVRAFLDNAREVCRSLQPAVA